MPPSNLIVCSKIEFYKANTSSRLFGTCQHMSSVQYMSSIWKGKMDVTMKKRGYQEGGVEIGTEGTPLSQCPDEGCSGHRGKF